MVVINNNLNHEFALHVNEIRKYNPKMKYKNIKKDCLLLKTCILSYSFVVFLAGTFFAQTAFLHTCVTFLSRQSESIVHGNGQGQSMPNLQFYLQN